MIKDDEIYNPSDFAKILKELGLPSSRMVFVYRYELMGICKSYKFSTGRRYYTGKLLKENIENIKKYVKSYS